MAISKTKVVVLIGAQTGSKQIVSLGLTAYQWIVRHLPHVIIPTSNYEFAIFVPLANQYLYNNGNHGRHEYRNRTFASHFRLSSH